MRLAYSALDPADAARYKAMVKQWMSEATAPSPYDSLGSIQLAAQTKAIMDDPAIAPRGELVLNKQYPNMAKAVHRRPDYAFGISMYNDKVANYELINNENLNGWHTGAGMTYLYDSDLPQYHDSFWPTVNSHRLPGTTVLRNSETPPHLKSGSNWVGGTEVDGLRESRTANWNSINGYFDDIMKDPIYFDDHTRHYVNLWFDHGTAPTDGSYAYVLLSGKSAAQTGSYADAPDIEIVENSAQAQAVRELRLGATGINFWQDAVKTVAGVTSNRKASVMLRTDSRGTEISAADPTMANKGTIVLRLDMELGPLGGPFLRLRADRQRRSRRARLHGRRLMSRHRVLLQACGRARGCRVAGIGSCIGRNGGVRRTVGDRRVRHRRKFQRYGNRQSERPERLDRR